MIRTRVKVVLGLLLTGAIFMSLLSVYELNK